MSRVKAIITPGVLENPGFEAWPPDLTAKGVGVEPIIFIYIEPILRTADDSREEKMAHNTSAVSLVEPTSTTHAEI